MYTTFIRIFVLLSRGFFLLWLAYIFILACRFVSRHRQWLIKVSSVFVFVVILISPQNLNEVPVFAHLRYEGRATGLWLNIWFRWCPSDFDPWGRWPLYGLLKSLLLILCYDWLSVDHSVDHLFGLLGDLTVLTWFRIGLGWGELFC